MTTLIEIAQAAKIASRISANLDENTKNQVLNAIADALITNSSKIITQNQLDLALAKQNNMNEALLDRLTLTHQRVNDLALGVKQISDLADPINEIIDEWISPDGLNIKKIRVALGVIGMIYEARPNVTVDAATLAFKAGNAIILRGSSSAFNTNLILVEIMRKVLIDHSINPDIICLLSDLSRDAVNKMLKLRDYIDLIVPRGGASLINDVVNNATVPILETGTGNCHIYIDENADYQTSANIVLNAKTQRPGVCNAVETVLINQNWPYANIQLLITTLLEHKVELYGDQFLCANFKQVKLASETDWQTEYLALVLAIKMVDDIDAAIAHINKYGTKHTECIITANKENAKMFQRDIDAAVVNVNASTRFTDGFMFGFGAELGISTQKTHARGPMGLKEITSYKYLVTGQGDIRK
ncbi:MAG: glutamate-5-semialdehyde dehydrogenase [Erysipelotrichaceae bacterium]|nr:glutamate-5-semialdehyde dehydrogenase [Erysipelotrichaceae bacterium]